MRRAVALPRWGTIGVTAVLVLLLVVTGAAATRSGPATPWTLDAAPAAPVIVEAPLDVSRAGGADRLDGADGGADRSDGVSGATVGATDEGATATGGAGATTPAGEARPAYPEASPEWLAAVAGATGIDPVALRAYARATLVLAEEDPACRVGWTTLAAIGRVESGHGSHGGAVLTESGRPDLLIIGPPLDGGPGVAAIRSTEATVGYHGDTVWDHAVGPMQFLPSTWERWGADGDGDGHADPHDIDDAALAAARYLCAGGGDLTTGPDWWAAVLSYNRSEEYAALVLTVADDYAVRARG